MATPAQTLANRANAQLSQGPITPAGKAASSQNATRHGLSASQFAILPGEDPAGFTGLLESLTAEFQPETDHELFLIDQMAKSRWKMIRVERLESEAFDDIVAGPGAFTGTPTSRILAAIKSSGNVLDKLQRYSAAAERSYFRALRELQNGRTHRLKAQDQAAEAYIKQFVFAPVPELVHRAASAPVQNEPKTAVPAPLKPAVQNEAKIKVTTNAYGLGNPALRL